MVLSDEQKAKLNELKIEVKLSAGMVDVWLAAAAAAASTVSPDYVSVEGCALLMVKALASSQQVDIDLCRWIAGQLQTGWTWAEFAQQLRNRCTAAGDVSADGAREVLNFEQKEQELAVYIGHVETHVTRWCPGWPRVINDQSSAMERAVHHMAVMALSKGLRSFSLRKEALKLESKDWGAFTKKLKEADRAEEVAAQRGKSSTSGGSASTAAAASESASSGARGFGGFGAASGSQGRGRGAGTFAGRLSADEHLIRFNKGRCFWCGLVGHANEACPSKARGEPRYKGASEDLAGNKKDGAGAASN